MDVDDVLNKLAAEGFAEKQKVIRYGNYIYPSKDLIVKIHRFLITHFRDKMDSITEGAINDGTFDFILFKCEQVGTMEYSKKLFF